MDDASAAEVLLLARQASEQLDGPDSSAWEDRLEQDLGRLRAAFDYLVNSRRDEQALELATYVWPFQFDRGHADEGRRWLETALALPGVRGPSSTRTTALYGAGIFAFRALDQEAAQRFFDALLTLAGVLGDDGARLKAYGALSRVALRRGDSGAIRRLSHETLTLARQRNVPEECANPLHMLAAAARIDGDLEGARKLYTENLELNRKLGVSRWVAAELLNIAAVDVLSGRTASAEKPLTEGLDLVESRLDHYLLPYALAWIGRLRLARSDPRAAAELLAAASGQAARTGMAMDPDEEPEFQKSVAMCKDLLTEGEFRTIWERGSLMDFTPAVALARRAL